MSNLDNMKGNRVLVVGFGRSGQAAARVMARMGAEVSVQDAKKESQIDSNLLTFYRGQGVTFYLDSMPPDMGAFDQIILSPGASPELGFVQEGKEKGAEIIGELEIAYRVGKGNYVAITGNNGKTTTTTLVGEIFRAAGRGTYVVGNIGTAVINASTESSEKDWLVTECSSFQLETTRYFKPVVSAILNLTPDHLNRHHTMEAYGKAKAKIFANQTEAGYLVINQDDRLCFSLAEGCRARIVPFSVKQELPFGAFLRGDTLVLRDDEKEIEICTRGDLKIIGMHNVQNVLAAAAISYFAGIEPAVITRVVKEFAGVAHRIEYCGKVDDVLYYNDSKGTNTDATEIALRAMERDVILIAGGDSKGQDFGTLVRLFPGKVKHLVLLGRDAHFIREACDAIGYGNYTFCKDMEECVRTAATLASPGDVVLLSPACASWDMYNNFEQRGDHFKDCVSRL